MILDAADNELTYWPISGLEEGDTSEVLTFKITTPVSNGYLSATLDARAVVYARRKGVGASYQNISTTPLNLSTLPVGTIEFEAYVQALSPIEGLERIALNVTPGSSSPAGWDT